MCTNNFRNGDDVRFVSTLLPSVRARTKSKDAVSDVRNEGTRFLAAAASRTFRLLQRPMMLHHPNPTYRNRDTHTHTLLFHASNTHTRTQTGSTHPGLESFRFVVLLVDSLSLSLIPRRPAQMNPCPSLSLSHKVSRAHVWGGWSLKSLFDRDKKRGFKKSL